jgi:hypothetical protein
VPVAVALAYDELWVDPRVVAALSGGVFTWTVALPWAPDIGYAIGSHVLDGDTSVPHGGYIWTALADLPAGYPAPTDPTQTGWERDDQATLERLAVYNATLSATWLLDTLTQGRLHGIETWCEDYQVNVCDIRLRRSPVTEVQSVIHISRCNEPGDEVANWCWKSAQTVSVCCNGCGYAQFACGCDNNVVRVRYVIGSNLPPGTEGLTAWLATEYGKAAQGKPCALPERVTNVTRQGVSWTILDPQDFYDKKMTGMARVDNWLNAVRLTYGGTYIDPLTSNRLFSRRCEPVPQQLED